MLRNPLNRGRAVTLTLDQFKYGWANALDDEEAERLYETYHVAAPGVALMQMANANLNPRSEAKLDPKNPDRGPLLILDGEKDHTVPWAIANASFKRQRHNQAVTEIQKVPNRGHSLTIDSGWREVAERALAFVKRFVAATPTEQDERNVMKIVVIGGTGLIGSKLVEKLREAGHEPARRIARHRRQRAHRRGLGRGARRR